MPILAENPIFHPFSLFFVEKTTLDIHFCSTLRDKYIKYKKLRKKTRPLGAGGTQKIDIFGK